LPRFPAATRDVACVVAQTVSHQDMLDAMASAAVEHVRAIRLFDLYQGDQVPAGCKSMAYHIEYRADDRTLTDDEVNAAHAKIVAALTAQAGAQIR
jgi:phenylalanyl-tRNA synthetase beta chain